MSDENVVSFAPDDLGSGGLASDFRGRITAAAIMYWNYQGNRDQYSLAVRLDIEPSEESGIEPFQQFYSAGDLKFFVPSEDGKNPVPGLDEIDDVEDAIGYYFYKVGSRTQISAQSNWGFFIRQASEAGFPNNEWSPDIRCLVGVDAYFVRVPKPKLSGLVDDGEGQQNRRSDVLVMNEYFGKDSGKRTSSAAKKKTTSKAATDDTAEEEGELSELETEVADAVVTTLQEAEDGTLKKAKLIQAVNKLFKPAQRPKVMKAYKSEAFIEYLEGLSVVYDSDEETFTLAE